MGINKYHPQFIAIANRCLMHSKPLAIGNLLCNTLVAMIPTAEINLSTFKSTMENPCKEAEEKMRNVCKIPLVISTVNTIAATVGQQKVSAECSINSAPLSSIVSELTSKYCEGRRKSILSKARTTLLADYHNTMFGTGDSLEDNVASAGNVGDARAMMEQSGASAMQALSFDCCQVSLAAWRILQLVHDTMKEACTPSSSVHNAHTLYQVS